MAQGMGYQRLWLWGGRLKIDSKIATISEKSRNLYIHQNGAIDGTIVYFFFSRKNWTISSLSELLFRFLGQILILGVSVTRLYMMLQEFVRFHLFPTVFVVAHQPTKWFRFEIASHLISLCAP